MPTASPSIPKPEAFLTVRVHQVDVSPSLCGLCVGYEGGSWRAAQLADHIIEWLPEFALTPSEWLSMQHANSVSLIRRAARIVYQSEKFQRRGEFGELFLHAAIRQVHDSLPAISKIYYKTGVNDTVKGFDAVHVVGPPEDMELWLGEAKFYESVNDAMNEVIGELEAHLVTDYLRSEFLLIKGKIDDAWPHAEPLKQLLSPNTSLDVVFKRACIPVLLTYDSECVSKHSACSNQYAAEFAAELTHHHSAFVGKMEGKLLPARLSHFLTPL